MPKSAELNRAGYQDLLKMCVNKRPGQDLWYARSYKAFKTHPVRNEADVLRVIAFAYSWMPRIPSLYRRKLRTRYVLRKLIRLKAGELRREDFRNLLGHLAHAVNHSVVGASKLLHFVAPAAVPMIDSRVIDTWRRLFFAGVARLRVGEVGDPSKPTTLPFNFATVAANVERDVRLYLSYCDNLMHWRNQLGRKTSLRSIEKALFERGR